MEREVFLLLTLIASTLLCPLASAQDINGDGVVNILDLNLVWKAFDSKPGEENWNPACDLNEDGVVNILDVQRVSREFGKETPPREEVNYDDKVVFEISRGKLVALSITPFAVWSDEFGLEFCESGDCLREKRVFFKDELVYFDFISEIRGLGVTGTLIYPDGMRKGISLPSLVRLGEVGEYAMNLVASGKSFGRVEKVIRFEVVEKTRCNENGKCEIDLKENFENCPQDCPSGSRDNYCDGIADGKCDPDCSEEEDVDCKPKKTLIFSLIVGVLVFTLTLIFLFKLRRSIR